MLRKFIVTTLFLASISMLAVLTFYSPSVKANSITNFISGVGDFLFGTTEPAPTITNTTNVTNPTTTVTSPITTTTSNNFTDEQLYAALARIKLPESIIAQLRGPQGFTGPRGPAGTGGTTIINPPKEPDTIVYNTYTSSGGGHSSSSDWRRSGDDVFYLAGNVGIGTSEPSALLDIDASGDDTTPLIIKTNGSAGNYTPTNSGIFVKNAAGVEMLRIFASDPDDVSDYNSGNTYIGLESGLNATTNNTNSGYWNTALGYKTMQERTTGVANSAIGSYALRNLTTGSNNIAVGSGTLSSNIIGSFNTGVGQGSLFNTLSSDNVGLGYDTLYYNTTGTKNIAIGSNAGEGDFTGADVTGNTFVGFNAGMIVKTNADYNTLLGYQSGKGTTMGARNTLIGPATIAASYGQVTSGSNNISIGNDVAVPTATASNQLDIGNFIYGTGLDGTGSTVSNAFIGFGMKNPSVALDVTGDIEYTGTITDVSDRRLKENITDYTGALDIISKLEAKNYNMISSPDKPEVGFLAQDVQNLFPSATSIIDPEHGYLGVSYVSLVPVISQALKELNLKVDNLASLNITDDSFIGGLTAKLIAWFGDVGNGITKLFVKEIHTDELCVGSVCVTEEEFLDIVGENHSASSGSVDTETETPEQPAPEDEENTPPSEDVTTPPDDQSVEEEAPAEESTPEPETPPVVE